MASGSPRQHWQRSTSWEELAVQTGSYGVTYQMYRIGAPDEMDAPTVVKSYFPPGTRIEPHSHLCDYTEIILEGSEEVTRVWHHAGHIRIAKAGTVYGPLIAGPEGVTKLLIFADGRMAMQTPEMLRAAGAAEVGEIV